MQEILKQIQRDLHCPICGTNFENGDIRLKGLFDQTIILHTTCPNGHTTVFMTTFQKKLDKKPVSTDDVLDLHNVLREFDGDFEKVFS